MAYRHVEPPEKRIMVIEAANGNVLWQKDDADTDGDALDVEWFVNGQSVRTVSDTAAATDSTSTVSEKSRSGPSTPFRPRPASWASAASKGRPPRRAKATCWARRALASAAGLQARIAPDVHADVDAEAMSIVISKRYMDTCAPM